MKNEKLVKKFDKQSKMYQRNLDNPAMAEWRKKIIPQAKGKVLEVGVGAGANFPFYKGENVHVTAVDFSPRMIDIARQTARDYRIEAEFIVGNVESLHFESDAFDCIVSTLTLCSYPIPVETLNKFNLWCKPDGKILLMEHGLSSSLFLSTTQKVIDPIYKMFSGCHGNRDIEKIVKESNLVIDHIERYWKGILYLVWAKPM